MTVRTPLCFDGSALRPMTLAEINEWKAYTAYLYSTAPTVTVTVVSSSGTLSPTMADTRLQAGAATTGRASSFLNEAGTAEPSTVTVNFDKLTGPTYDTSLSATADQGVLGYPVYLDSDNNIRAMSETDYRDTFIYATLTDMVSSSESSLTNGTFTITTSASVSNYTEVSGSNTVIFADTRADTSSYSAAGIPETLDQPTTITNYYLQRRSDARSFPSQALLFADTNGNFDQSDLTSDTSSFNAILKNDIRFYAAEDSAGNKLSYNINGSGNSRGTAMVDTRLNGSGNYQTLLAGLDDYRSQEFPDGSPATINTYTFKITQV